MDTGGSDVPVESGPDDLFALVGKELVGRFRVDAVVAEGGFGLVYRGVQLGLDRPVAIKVLKTPDDPKHAKLFLSTFQQEARTIAKLQHPAIVQVLDFGTTTMPSGVEAPFMVLEWIRGRPLEAVLEESLGEGGRAPAACLDLFRPVLEAVDVAHKAGVAHRDLKPANVMVVETPRGHTLRLLDFGIAKIMEGDTSTPTSGMTRTASGASAFSPRYAAPEQVSGARTGPWTDVHALGLIMVEMLVDRYAYEVKDMTSLYRAVLAPTRPTPAHFGVDVGTWEPVLLRALAPHPADRYQDAGAFLNALAEALPGATHHPRSDAVLAATALRDLPGSATPAPSTTMPSVGVSNPPPPPARSRQSAFIVGVSAVVVLGGALTLVSLYGSTPSTSATTSAAITARAQTGRVTAPPPEPTPLREAAPPPPTPAAPPESVDAGATPVEPASTRPGSRRSGRHRADAGASNHQPRRAPRGEQFRVE